MLGAIRGALFDELELRERKTSDVVVANVVTGKHLGQVGEIGRPDALRNGPQLLGCHLRHRHGEDFEVRVERGADVGPFWFVYVGLAIADFDLYLTVRQQRSGDPDVVEVETASAVGCRWFLGMEADCVTDAGLSDCLGDLDGIELVLCRIVTGGIDVLAEAENAVDVTQDEPALEDELARISKREVRSEREESEVSSCELQATGALSSRSDSWYALPQSRRGPAGSFMAHVPLALCWHSR